MNYFQAIREEAEKLGVKDTSSLFLALLYLLGTQHQQAHQADQKGNPVTISDMILREIDGALHPGAGLDTGIKIAEYQGKTEEAQAFRDERIGLRLIKHLLERFAPIWTADGVDAADARRWLIRE
ncbi:MAG TPA: hypothetical protein VH120_19935 [Gemmataceae bacterium]|nr:hypothetical protein [Gemmataceae bacterium]